MGNDINRFGQREELRETPTDSKRVQDLPGRDEAQQALVRRVVEAKRKDKGEKKAGRGAQEFLKTHFKRPPLKTKTGNKAKMKASAKKNTPRATTSKLKAETGLKDKEPNSESINPGNKLGRNKNQSMNESHRSSTLENGAPKSSKRERLDQKVNDWLNNENNLWTFHEVSADVTISRNQVTGIEGEEAPVPPVYAFRQDPHMPFHLPYYHPHVYPNDINVSATLPRSHSIGASNEQHHHRHHPPVYAAFQPFMYHPYFTPYIPQFYHNQSTNPHHYPPVYHNPSQLIPFLSPQLARGSRQAGESRSKSQNNLAEGGNSRNSGIDISAHSDTALPTQQGRKAKLMSTGAVSDDLVSTHRLVGSTFDSIDCLHHQSSFSRLHHHHHHHHSSTYHDSSRTTSTTCNDVIFDDGNARPDNTTTTADSSISGNNPIYRKEAEAADDSPLYSLSLQYADAKAVEQPTMKLRESQSIVATSFQTSSGKFFCLTRSKSSSVNPAITPTTETNPVAPLKEDDEEAMEMRITTADDREVPDDDSSIASTLESDEKTEQTSEENDDTKVGSDDEESEEESGSSNEEEEQEEEEEEEEEEEPVIDTEPVPKTQQPPVPRPRSRLSIPSASTLSALVENEDTTPQEGEESADDDGSSRGDSGGKELTDSEERRELEESELMMNRMFMSLSSSNVHRQPESNDAERSLHKQLSETKREQSEDLLKRVNHILNGKSEFVTSESSGSEASWMMNRRSSVPQQSQQQHPFKLQRTPAIVPDEINFNTSPTYRSTFNYKLISPTKELSAQTVEAKVEVKPAAPPEVKDFLGGRRESDFAVRESPFIRRQANPPEPGKSETLEERAARILGRSARGHASLNTEHATERHEGTNSYAAHTTNLNQEAPYTVSSSSTSSGISGELQSYGIRPSEYKLPNDVLRRHDVKSPTHSAPGRESIMASFAMTDRLYERSPTATTATTTTNGSVRLDGNSSEEEGDFQKKFSKMMMRPLMDQNASSATLPASSHSNGEVMRNTARPRLTNYKDQLNAVATAVGFNRSHVRQFQSSSAVSKFEKSNQDVNLVGKGSTSSSSMSSNSDNQNHATLVRQKQNNENPPTSSRGQQVQSESQVREVMESLGLNPDESWMVSL